MTTLSGMPNRPRAREFPHDAFVDVLDANTRYSSTFRHSELSGTAREGLAIVTCIDSRIEPLSITGMHPGDVKIIRNAGARVTDDVLRTLLRAEANLHLIFLGLAIGGAIGGFLPVAAIHLHF